jgi:hypothetical protein
MARVRVRIAQERRSKYRAIPTEIDGVRFASKAEARRYCELRLLERDGSIQSLYLQPAYVLHAGDEPIGRYVADFSYTDAKTGEIVVEDVKGFRTPLYKWKKRHVEKQYGIVIREIR